jgi:xanthine dehydrogenase accessory factor
MNLWIAGSGHIARAVAPIALQLDFKVTVFDDRPALANHTYFPQEAVIRADYWETLLREPLPQSPVFGLIVTRGHQHDALVLKEWINKPFAFLGMIGSQRKKRVIFDGFVSEGIASRARLNSVACPVGMNIDAASVEEIAVSIAAQFVQERARLRRNLQSNSAPIKVLA